LAGLRIGAGAVLRAARIPWTATVETLTDQPPVRGETLPAGRHVEADELELLFKYLGTLETASGACSGP
jgi:hypothetical protein